MVNKNIDIILKVIKLNILVSSQNIRNSELFKRLNILTAREMDIVEKTLTDDIVHCGISCSSEETCSGMQYDSQTKVCLKMKKVEELFLMLNHYR